MPDECRRCDLIVVPLREHIEAKITMIEHNTMIAKADMERRLDAMNEFRATLQDQASRFLTRVQHDEAMMRIQADIQMLRESKATLEGKASQSSVLLALAISVLGLLLAGLGLAYNVFAK